MVLQSASCLRQFGSFEWRRSVLRRLFGVFVGLVFLPFMLGFGKEDLPGKDTAATELVPGKSLSGMIPTGGSQVYWISLSPGQFLHVAVDQNQNDLVITIFGPEGEELGQVDSRAYGPEPLSLVAQRQGIYRVKVASAQNQRTPLPYEIHVSELRETSDQDQRWMAAETASTQAKRLQQEETAKSLAAALEKFKEALPLWQKLGDRHGEAHTLNRVGYITNRVGSKTEALAYLEKARQVFQELSDRNGVAHTLVDLGTVHDDLGNKPKAMEYYTEAYELFRSLEHKSGQGAALLNTAVIHTGTGDRRKALELYQQALLLKREVGDRVGEGLVLSGLGRVHHLLGEGQKALDYFHEALSVRRAVKDRRGEAQTLTGIGLVLDSLGEREKSVGYLLQALPIYQEVADSRGEAATLNNLGVAYRLLGKRKEAEENLLKALALVKKIGDRYGEGYALTQLGMMAADLRETARTTVYFNQALELRRAVGDRSGESQTLGAIADTYAASGDVDKALAYFSDSLQLKRAISDVSGEARTLYRMASLERDRGNLLQAESLIKTAIGLVESTRMEIASHQLRSSYIASVRNYYDLFVDLLSRLHQRSPSEGYDRLALYQSERSRARSLLESLAESRFEIRRNVEPDLLQQERSLQEKINRKAEQHTRLLGGKHTEGQAAASKKEIEDLLDEYRHVQGQIRTRSPRYAALTQPEPLTVKEIQDEVLDDDTLLLNYALGEERSHLWAVTRHSLAIYELPKRAEIERLAREVYGLLNRPPRSASTPRMGSSPGTWNEEAYWRSTRQLSQTLLSPVADRLLGQRLLIVAEGALQYIPFGALPDPSTQLSSPSVTSARAAGPLSNTSKQNLKNLKSRTTEAPQPLLVRHEIVRAPSVSILALLRREQSNRKPAPKLLAVLADPVFDSQDSRVVPAKGGVPVGPVGGNPTPTRFAASLKNLQTALRDTEHVGELRIGRLAFSRREAEAIAALASPNMVKKAFDFEASRETASDPQLGNYRMLHFATHGLLNNTHPELSGLILSLVDQRGWPLDGFLRLHEIYNLNLNAELVVLSACQTGLGKDIKGEGLIGLTRGFMYAGAPRVVVSLWKVNDQATAELMKRFYQGMLGKQRLRPAAALRAAQLALRKQKSWQSPYFWAPFVIEGDWK